MSNNSTRKLISFTPVLNDMVERIREIKGFPSFSAVIHAAIIEYDRKCNPTYVKKANYTPEEQAAREIDRKKSKLRLLENEKMEIARKLGGTVTGPEGDRTVRFYNYHGKSRFEQQMPLEMLNEEFIKRQYHPSKQQVDEWREKGELKY